MNMNSDPDIIGYWARIHKLSWEDCRSEPRINKHLESVQQQKEFRKGWLQADKELHDEKIQNLLVDLSEINEPEQGVED